MVSPTRNIRVAFEPTPKTDWEVGFITRRDSEVMGLGGPMPNRVEMDPEWQMDERSGEVNIDATNLFEANEPDSSRPV